jgi:hypothetical protein
MRRDFDLVFIGLRACLDRFGVNGAVAESVDVSKKISEVSIQKISRTFIKIEDLNNQKTTC